MKKTLLLFLALLLTAKVIAQSSNFKWVRQLGGPAEDMPSGLALDKKGNILTTGSFLGTSDFDPGPSTYSLTSTNPWYIFISKLNAQGNFVWAQKLGNVNSEIYANSVAADTAGNVYVTGYFNGNIDFNAGVGQHLVVGNYDGFVLKLDSSGNFLWATILYGVKGKDITTDAGGNSYTTGDHNGVYVSKLDATGNIIWSYQAGGSGSSYGSSIACSNTGNLFVTGSFDTTTDFDPSSSVLNLISSYGLDAFILKLNNSGTLGWVKQIAGSADEYGIGIAVDNLENTYSTGLFRMSTDFDPGPGTQNVSTYGFSDVYILKLDATGNFDWVKHFGGSESTYSQDITLDKNKNIYTTGGFSGTVDIYSSNYIIPLNSSVYNDIYISKSDSSGNFLWAKQMGGPLHDGGMAIAADVAGNIFTTGFFQKACDFNPDPAIDTLDSFGDRDVFIHKMGLCTPSQTISIGTSQNIVCIGATVTLTATGALTYTWDSGSNATQQILSPVNYPLYFVYGTDANGCSSSATITQGVSTCAGIETFTQQKLTAYPNPNNGAFQVTPSFAFQNCSFELMDPQGRILEKGQQPFTEKIDFDFSAMKYINGMYFLKLNFDGKVTVIKLVLQNER